MGDVEEGSTGRIRNDEAGQGGRSGAQCIQVGGGCAEGGGEGGAPPTMDDYAAAPPALAPAPLSSLSTCLTIFIPSFPSLPFPSHPFLSIGHRVLSGGFEHQLQLQPAAMM